MSAIAKRYFVESWADASIYTICLSAMISLVCILFMGVGAGAYMASSEKARLDAYTRCLATMEKRSIQDMNTFCDRLRDRI